MTTVCADCKHLTWGAPHHPPREANEPPPPPRLRETSRVCAMHARGRTERDPVTGRGGDVLIAVSCRSVNTGECPDFVQVNWIVRHFRRTRR